MEHIINKLGFNPLTIADDEYLKLVKDDSPTPYSVLTDEEMAFLDPYMLERIKKEMAE